ncbi:MAG: Bcr/CflA family multidrug efflux MFS transporter [Azospirillaceae bacterium]
MPDTPAPPPPRTVLKLAFILGAAMATTPLAVDMYLPTLPTIREDFGATEGSTQLSLTAFFVGLAIGQIIYGPIADRVGRRLPLLSGILLFIAASVACALSTSIEMMIPVRFLQAAGGCAGMVISRAVVRDLFDRQGSARMFSLLVLVMGTAPIVAPLLGGYLAAALGWQAIFWFLAAVGIATLVAVWLALPETLRPENRRSPGIGNVVATYLLLLRDRRYVGYAVAGGVAQAGMFAYISGSPFVFIEVFDVPATLYGWLFAINVIGLVTMSQVNRWLLARWESERILRVANTAVALFGLAVLAAALSGVLGLVGLMIPLFGYISLLGVNMPNAMAGALAQHAPRAGAASALIGTFQFTAAGVAGTLVGQLHDGTPLPMGVVVALCGAASWIGFRLLVPAPPR